MNPKTNTTHREYFNPMWSSFICFIIENYKYKTFYGDK